jgi:hypothetical protein
MRNNSLLAMEIIWIATGILSAGAAIKMAITDDGYKIIFFSLMAVVSFTFALIRHKQRKKS